MQNSVKTGRPLQLEHLAYSQNKVTLGFKCDPLLKIEMAEEASNYGMTLSEYVEVVVSNRKTLNQTDNLEIKELKKKISFYENDTLKRAFYRHRGRNIKYQDYNGVDKTRTINSIEDVYCVLLETVKLN